MEFANAQKEETRPSSPKRSTAENAFSAVSDGDISVREIEEKLPKATIEESKAKMTVSDASQIISNDDKIMTSTETKQGTLASNDDAAGQDEEEAQDKGAAKSGSGKRIISQKAVEFFGYETEQQLLRSKALERMGLTEDDMYKAAPHFMSSDKQDKMHEVYQKKGLSEKLPAITGMTEEQIMRRKAVETLGTTEDSIDLDRVEKLANLGTSGPKVNSSCSAEDANCLT